MKRTNCGPAPVRLIEAGSAAEKAGIRPGDHIWKLDGVPLRDVLDLYMGVAGCRPVAVDLERDGQMSQVILDVSGAPCGIEVSEAIFGQVVTCDNNCMFCFVDQLPAGLRKSLYVKDDDYRLSFLSGNFITLTNMTRADVKRITSERISPLYVSLHATQTVIRKKMFGNPEAARSMKILKELLRAGIDIHIQIVLVHGVNDGEHLDATLQDLRLDYRGTRSIGIVPVGISTGGRRTLDVKYAFDKASAAQVISQVDMCRGKLAPSTLSAADEFFFMAGLEPPDRDYYGDFDQLENGIGLARLFRDEFDEMSPVQGIKPGSLAGLGIITTPIGGWTLAPLGLEKTGASLIVCDNTLFGERVNVCGLLPGDSVLQALSARTDIERAIVPAVALDDELRFIDGMSLAEVSSKSEVGIDAVGADGASLAEALICARERGCAG